MNISAVVSNHEGRNEVVVTTNSVNRQMSIPSKPGGGSAVNGGELLFLALATCCCNDIYREAAKRSMPLRSVEVLVSGEFGAEGEPGFNIHYEVKIDADAPAEAVKDLVLYVDRIAEVHNTLRKGTEVKLKMT